MEMGLLRMVCSKLSKRWPLAYADILGSEKYPDIGGTVEFYDWKEGTIVAVEVEGLPLQVGEESHPILGFHIHEGESCSGDEQDPFANALGHFNPGNTLHLEHAGDMPPIFANKGLGVMIFYTDRFKPQDIIGRTVIIHELPDDFKTQPSGNSGEKIACGEIKEVS